MKTRILLFALLLSTFSGFTQHKMRVEYIGLWFTEVRGFRAVSDSIKADVLISDQSLSAKQLKKIRKIKVGDTVQVYTGDTTNPGMLFYRKRIYRVNIYFYHLLEKH